MILSVRDKRYEPLTAVQLTWAGWPDVCAVIDVGAFDLGKPEGCYIAEDGTLSDEFLGESDSKLGLKIPKGDSFQLACQGDWLVKDSEGVIHVYTADEFTDTYEVIVPYMLQMSGQIGSK